MSSGILFVLSAPSGGGKTTILRKVMADLPGLVFSVSHTTRSPRPREVDGRDYHFVSRDDFNAIQSSQPPGFLEWAEVHNNLYGTSCLEVEQHLEAGQDVILDIDVQGAMQVKKCSEPVSIFIAPPSLDELERRLCGRGTESADIAATRLRNAIQEMKFVDEYDYLIINDSLSDAVDSLRSIIIAERCRRRRFSRGAPATLSF